MHELNHGQGKGDKDRSPGWRNRYDEIDWQRDKTTGFRKGSMGIRKIYRRNLQSQVPAPEPETPPVFES